MYIETEECRYRNTDYHKHTVQKEREKKEKKETPQAIKFATVSVT